MRSQTENYTRNIYTLIDEENYTEVLRILENELNSFPDSTAIHSIMLFVIGNKKIFKKLLSATANLFSLTRTMIPTNYTMHIVFTK